MGRKPIFEEINALNKQSNAPRKGAIARGGSSEKSYKMLQLYLAVLFALVALMILVGGLTRLTDSGLSITEWNLVTGMIPPLSEAMWQSEFVKYQGICEFQEQNSWMSLSDFKTIYWWEWGHRQLGRFIGLVWGAGFLLLALSHNLPRGWSSRLWLLGGLGAFQGAVGWWMVSSGITSPGLAECRVDVSSIRLAIHLGLAFVTLGFLSWFLLRLSRASRDLMAAGRLGNAPLAIRFRWLAALIFFQILLGALVAGIDAGRSYNAWPMMAEGQFLPPMPFELQPIWMNFIENAGLVQFIHRMTGYLILVLGIGIWFSSRKSAHRSTRKAADLLLVAILLQLLLGVLAVVNSARIEYALPHQLGAIFLWWTSLRAVFLARYPIPEQIRQG